ncbi:MAG: alanine--tRNA ligase [Thermoplasmata archaeon]|nr:MAG: alanine--tRNA ligase [Thermoplasmata archaeon]
MEMRIDLSFFRENHFKRKRCRSCGSFFWTLDRDRDLCGDQPCVDFSFIGEPLTRRSYTVSGMRNEFLGFFERNGHERIDPYPVVARWRKDIYLTIASIAVFQPHVTSGLSKPPANPLVISQPSIRLNDLEEVGVSGKHLTIFEMMGHHAFNSPEEHIYWMEETIRYCHDFLTRILGIDEREITYKESMWEGGGNAGPCLEVLAGGLEIATLVFMNMVESAKGRIKIGGKRYAEMDMKVVDTGYGLERLTWISRGTDTIYDVLYPEVIDHISGVSEKIDRHLIYALADHSKCIAFMLGDGIVPSNAKAGYLARLMIRRALRFMRILGIREGLYDIVEIHLKSLRRDFPRLYEARKRIEEILELEDEKYRETLRRGSSLVEKILKEKKRLCVDDLVQLYDAHGIHPEMVKGIAERKGIRIDVPEDFDSLIAGLHSEEEEEEIERFHIPGETRSLYYEDEYLRRFKAKVIWSGIIDGKHAVVLDKTCFYPEGGGQPSDRGKLKVRGKEVDVEHVEKVGKAILHYVSQPIDEGEDVEGFVDWERRYSLMRHHTATHIINSACRKVLGDHVWQAGSQLDVDVARFDFSHYRTLREEEIRRIEDVANSMVREGIDVIKEFLERSEAEKRYGVILYQGGVPEGRMIRVVRIPEVDVEACGGTHLNNTSEVGRIKIVGAERVQDGVNRLIFVAGEEKVEELERKERERLERLIDLLKQRFNIATIEKDAGRALREISRLFSVPMDKIEDTIRKFMEDIPEGRMNARCVVDACEKLFREWKKVRKERKRIPKDLVEELLKGHEEFEGYRLIFLDAKTLRGYDPMAVADELRKANRVVACIKDAKGLIFSASDDVEIDLREIARKVGSLLGGGGGGKERLARCGGKDLSKIGEAMKKARRLIEDQLKG